MNLIDRYDSVLNTLFINKGTTIPGIVIEIKEYS
jgi:hypothetical protein